MAWANLQKDGSYALGIEKSNENCHVWFDALKVYPGDDFDTVAMSTLKWSGVQGKENPPTLGERYTFSFKVTKREYKRSYNNSEVVKKPEFFDKLMGKALEALDPSKCYRGHIELGMCDLQTEECTSDLLNGYDATPKSPGGSSKGGYSRGQSEGERLNERLSVLLKAISSDCQDLSEASLVLADMHDQQPNQYLELRQLLRMVMN